MRQRYKTDLTDEQWAVIEPLLPAAKPGGRPREVDLREVVNTLLYQARTGCSGTTCRTTWCPRARPTTTSRAGATTAPGRGWWTRCAARSARRRAARPRPAPRAS